jgi:hypothetical protein
VIASEIGDTRARSGVAVIDDPHVPGDLDLAVTLEQIRRSPPECVLGRAVVREITSIDLLPVLLVYRSGKRVGRVFTGSNVDSLDRDPVLLVDSLQQVHRVAVVHLGHD